MVARNPIGYLGGSIILTSDKKKQKQKLYVRLYTTRNALHSFSHYGYGDWDQSHVSLLCSALRVTVLDGIRSPDLPLSRRDLYRHRCLGPRNPSARSIYLPFRLERRGLKYKQGTSRIRTQVVGMERLGLTSQATDVSDLTW